MTPMRAHNALGRTVNHDSVGGRQHAAAQREHQAMPLAGVRAMTGKKPRHWFVRMKQFFSPNIPQWFRGALVAPLVLSTGSCGGRNSSDYLSFVASHDSIGPGMSIRQVFEAGLVDYMIKAGGKNVPGSTVPEKQPVSAECRRHVFEVHYGSGDLRTPGGYDIRVYCNMNGPSDRQVTPQGAFQSKGDFLRGLETYSSWAKSMSFRVESPALKIGGVYDSYNFATDESAKIVTVSSINKSSN